MQYHLSTELPVCFLYLPFSSLNVLPNQSEGTTITNNLIFLVAVKLLSLFLSLCLTWGINTSVGPSIISGSITAVHTNYVTGILLPI